MKTRKLTKGRRRNPLSLRGGRNAGRRHQASFEQLEPRHLLSISGLTTETETLPFEMPDFVTTADRVEMSESFSLGLAAAHERTLDQSFAFYSNLDRYTQEQLESADRWVVRSHDTFTPADMTSRLSITEASPFLPIENTYLVSAGDQSLDDLLLTFSNDASIRNFYPSLPTEVSPTAWPNDPYLEYQWHLINTGQETGNPDHLPVFAQWGEDIRIFPVWEDYGYTGEGVTIGIVDSGTQYQHPDLEPNYNPLLSYDYVDLDDDPSPGSPSAYDAHGTAVAGVAAGVGDNEIGITGVAYNSELVGIRALSETGNAEAEYFYDALTHEWDEIEISNNSWGRTTLLGVIPATPFELQAISDAHFLGRGGLGTVFVWAAGNDGGNSDYEALASHRYTIGVAALTEEGIPTSYSNGGSSLITSAYSGSANGSSFIPVYGGGIWTTDLAGNSGLNLDGLDEDPLGIDPFARDYFADTNYTSRFSGTSSAAPVVSGVVALMLEVNPNLTARDVQHILVRAGRHTSFNEFVGQPSNILSDLGPLFFTNSAGNSFSYGLGHGVVDTELAVRLAQNWQLVGPETTLFSPNTIHGNSSWIFPAPDEIPECDDTICPGRLFSDSGADPPFPGISFETGEVPDDMVVEWVEFTIGLSMDEAESDLLEIFVRSPDGTEDLITSPMSTGPAHEYVPEGDQLNWTFRTNNFWGERSGGVWEVDFHNYSRNSAVDLQTVRIDWFGAEAGGSARVQGSITQDFDGDGEIDTELNPFGQPIPVEPKADGLMVYVDLNENGFREEFEPYSMTGNDGNYYFDLDPHPTGGQYHIRLETPTNMTITAGNELNLVSLSKGSRVTLSPTLVNPDVITVSGNVFIDADGDGINNGEPPAVNYSVFADLNRDGVPSAGDAFTTTDFLGNYTLTVDEGTDFYAIFVIPQSGLEVTTPASGYHYLFLAAGEVVTNLTFAVGTEGGNVVDPDAGTITGYLFNDLNGDGIRDLGDPGLVNWLVFVDLDDDGSLGLGEPQFRTLGDGSYTFVNLSPDVYRIRAVGQSDWSQTAPADDGSYLIEIFPEQIVSNVNFGFENLATRDFGDLPLGYPVLEADDGPTHIVQPGFYIGDFVDGELDGAPSANSLGDDLLGLADEDGITFLDPLNTGSTVRIEVRANTSGGYLQGWADFDHDFAFGVGERIVENILLDPGVNLLSFAIPASATPGNLAFRFRYGEFGIDLPTGSALGGEVEDYLMPAVFRVPAGDFNLDGNVDGADFLIWQGHFGMSSGATVFEGDGDGDGDVDGTDFLVWQSNFGTTGGGGSDSQVPPSPAPKTPGDGSDTDPIQPVLDGDFDADGVVDGQDFLVWQVGFDDIYDVDDFAVWEQAFQAAEANPVEEEAGGGASSDVVQPVSNRVPTVNVDAESDFVARREPMIIDQATEQVEPVSTPVPVATHKRTAAMVAEPIVIAGNAAVNALSQPVRIDQTVPEVKPFVRNHTRLEGLSADDAIRFDLAIREFDAISPAVIGARAKLAAPSPVVEPVDWPARQNAELRDVVFEAPTIQPMNGRETLKRRGRDEVVELLANDRMDRIATGVESLRSNLRFDR